MANPSRDKLFHKGNYEEDAKTFDQGEWILGHFMKHLPHRTEALEIKCWNFTEQGETTHPSKMCRVLECTFILEGEVQGFVDCCQVTLKQGDYVVIRPGIPNNLTQRITKEPAKGITIKAPSIFEANTRLESTDEECKKN